MKGFVCSLMRSLPTWDKTPEVYFLHKAANKQLRAQHSSDKIFFPKSSEQTARLQQGQERARLQQQAGTKRELPFRF